MHWRIEDDDRRHGCKVPGARPRAQVPEQQSEDVATEGAQERWREERKEVSWSDCVVEVNRNNERIRRPRSGDPRPGIEWGDAWFSYLKAAGRTPHQMQQHIITEWHPVLDSRPCLQKDLYFGSSPPFDQADLALNLPENRQTRHQEPANAVGSRAPCWMSNQEMGHSRYSTHHQTQEVFYLKAILSLSR